MYLARPEQSAKMSIDRSLQTDLDDVDELHEPYFKKRDAPIR